MNVLYSNTQTKISNNFYPLSKGVLRKAAMDVGKLELQGTELCRKTYVYTLILI